jgi:TonB family protein
LKATFKLFDEKGDASDQGTYEEYWSSPTKFKRIFNSTAYTQTDYGTDKGVLRSGTPQDLPALLIETRREFAADFPTQPAIEHESFSLQKIDTRGTTLSCFRMTAPLPDPGLTYCLDADKPILRISAFAGESLQVLHNRISVFQGHFVAGDLNFVRNGKSVLSAHLETIEPLTSVNEADFAPTPDAVLLPRRINISAGVAVGLLDQNRAVPIYPPHAKKARISGTIVMRAVIDVHGRVANLNIVSGPPELQQAAMDAVRMWHYMPYLLNGEPVEVQTLINVIFTLGQ